MLDLRKTVYVVPILGMLLLTACGNHETQTARPMTQESLNSRETFSEDAPLLDNEDSSENMVVDEGVEPIDGSEFMLSEDVADVLEETVETPEITLVMVGDVLLHTPLAEGGKNEEGGYDFSSLFSNMREEIEEADLALVNQEVIIGGQELGVSGYPCFNAPYELGDVLVEVGFDVILHATNHALDKGKKGILNCLEFWRENYPDEAVLGIHDSEEDSRDIFLYEQDGIKIAVLNYTYGTNGIPMPEGMPYAVDILEEERVIADLKYAEEVADFTIVCPHWGTEYRLEQTKEQEKWAKLFAKYGADLILGTHPHVIEPISWLYMDEEGQWVQTTNFENEDGVLQGTLVYYSLGNFCNWTSGIGEGVANRMVGGMAKVSLQRTPSGEVCISDWCVEPLVCHLEPGFGGACVYPLNEYNEELAEKNEIRKQDSNFSLDYCWNLAQTVFGNDILNMQ